MQNFQLPGSLQAELTQGADIEKRYKIFGNEFGPQKIYRIFDPADDRTWGFVAVDNLMRGRGLGGVRMVADISADEVYGLAAAMTLKSAAAMLPLGGAKSGLRMDSRVFAGQPEAKKKFFDAYIEPGGGSSAAFGQLIRSESVKWGEIIKLTGAKVD